MTPPVLLPPNSGDPPVTVPVAPPFPLSETRPSPAAFPRAPGETPRALHAFAAYFELGPHRSLAALAAEIGENLDTLKRWSRRHRWADRLATFEADLLQHQTRARAAERLDAAARRSQRTAELSELQWTAAQKLLAAAQCFLDAFGEREMERMTLAGVSRALLIASHLARHSLATDFGPEDPVSPTPLDLELAAALKTVYGPPAVTPNLPAAPPADAPGQNSS